MVVCAADARTRMTSPTLAAFAGEAKWNTAFISHTDKRASRFSDLVSEASVRATHQNARNCEQKPASVRILVQLSADMPDGGKT